MRRISREKWTYQNFNYEKTERFIYNKHRYPLPCDQKIKINMTQVNNNKDVVIDCW